jgi:AraC-like DNA-binding protein
MTPESFTTSSLPAHQQFEAWCAWFDPVFDVATGNPPDQGFSAAVQTWRLDGCALSRVSAPSIRVIRTPTHIRRNPVDHWVITLGGSVTTAIRTDSSSLDAPASVPFVLSLANQLVSQRTRDDRLQLYLARDDFREIASVLDAARGSVIATPLGGLLANYMLLLEQHLPDLSQEDLPRLKGAVGAMVGACVAPSPDRMAAASSQMDFGRLEKVRRAVRRSLRASSLGPSLLCRQVGMSRSQLYRLLENEGGVARYIQRQRLLEAYAVLCDPSNSKPIAIIAEELCFADASGFSRAFRQEFDCSPSDIRVASRAGFAPTAIPKDRIGPVAPTLAECLRSF